MNEEQIREGNNKGFELAKRRTKDLRRLLSVKPVYTVMAYAYMAAVQDIASLKEIRL